MRPVLYYHPFSSYSQKVLIALYENGTPFERREFGPEDPGAWEELAALWPVKRFPMLKDESRQQGWDAGHQGHAVFEASTIIEYLQLHYPGPVRLIPDLADLAIAVRMLDRFFDNYVSTPQQAIVFDALRKPEDRDPLGVAKARDMLDAAYLWLEAHMGEQHDRGCSWAVGETFTLADCAAAPFLFYADWTHPLGDRFPAVTAYRQRLLARPSFARAVDEARPYRTLFPLGAPDRD
ncbi:MAG: glutathione S-transferase family protein [Neorhizobium sp.]|nr:glutathione S-transferase family protein [Neorhizobium sp.]